MGQPLPPLTPEDLTDRTRPAGAAAVEAARAMGAEVDRATVLHDVFSAVVQLEPLPLVARVPVVLPPRLTPEQQATRQSRELAVTRWLADRGVPVIARRPCCRRNRCITTVSQ